MNPAVAPAAAEDPNAVTLTRRAVGAPPSPSGPRGRGTELALDFILQVFENSGDGNDDGDTIMVNDLYQPARMSFGGEGGRAFKQNRNKQAL